MSDQLSDWMQMLLFRVSFEKMLYSAYEPADDVSHLR